MDVSIAEKKLREARFFLDHMRVQEGRAAGDREVYDFFLSAFLSASRSVLLRLEEARGPFAKVFLPWRKTVWGRGLPRPERKAPNRLVEFFATERKTLPAGSPPSVPVSVGHDPIPSSATARRPSRTVREPPPVAEVRCARH